MDATQRYRVEYLAANGWHLGWGPYSFEEASAMLRHVVRDCGERAWRIVDAHGIRVVQVTP